MKNACLFLKGKNEYLTDSGHTAVADAFLSGGYAFDETLVLNLENERSIFDGVKGYKNVCDNVVVIVSKSWLQSVRVLLGEIFPSDVYQGVSTGAGVFVDGEKTLFLLACDDVSQGINYVKDTCLPYLQKKYDRQEKITLRAIGADEALIFDLIAKAKSMSGVSLAYTHKRRFDEDVIEIFYDKTVSRMLTDDVLRLFAQNLDGYLYAYDDDASIEEQVVRLLKLRGKKISVAESFTGGGIAKKLTSVSGASEVYFEGVNAYHEVAKMMRLGVSERTLLQQGAVSQETAYEMATGLLSTGACDVCIATTGLAGPNTDKSGLPVGLCYLAIGTKEKVHVFRYKFDGTREEITQKAINHALFHLYKTLKDI